MSTLRLPAFAFVTVLAIAACSGGASPTPSVAAPSSAASAPTSAAASTAASAVAASAGAVEIKGFAFNPATVSVKVGGKVTWTNNDGTTHTVTLDDNSVDSGNVNAGATFDHTFAAAGTFTYHCKIHPTMHGTVQVTS